METQNRIEQLNELIEKRYAGVDPDLAEELASLQERWTITMVEVVAIGEKSVVLRDHFNDTEFKPAVFPPEILYLLAPGDVFLATMGFWSGRWVIFYLSPAYESGDWTESGDSEELET